ncbi:MAG: hypothetical protein ABIL09_00100, partial [Gemmatimonadota bacterium]
MKRHRGSTSVALALAGAILATAACGADHGTEPGATGGTNMYARWTNGPPQGDDYFPIAVWLQDPANAARYQAAGINLYVGLWQGPTEAQLEALR